MVESGSRCVRVCVLFTYSLLFVAAGLEPAPPYHRGCSGRVCTPNFHLTIIATTMMNNVYAVRVRDVTMHACLSSQSEG